MKSAIQVASPPPKPLVVFDGECTFCRFWVRRWQHATGELVDYAPFQDAELEHRFPELKAEQFSRAVHLLDTDGSVYSGAEAAFRALAQNPEEHWLFQLYEHYTAFASISERAYRFIAEHRSFFSTLTRWCWGKELEPPSYVLVRSVFLRGLGLIYLAAFLSFWVQVDGLIGSHGILSAKDTIEVIRTQALGQHIGIERFHLFPTLCWFNASDRFLHIQCAAGVASALLLLIGVAPAPCLFLLWLVYLSLTTIGGEFMSFQWDSLLLETGFLAIFLAPLRWTLRFSGGPPPSRLIVWLFRFLLFRLMFESGAVKLLSGDPTWRNLTALNVHYETQPLPTWVGWYAHQLPASVQKASTAIMLGIELVLPFFIFAPPRPRRLACYALLGLQVVIFLTGNYCFFNLLTMALCLLLLEDGFIARLLPVKLRSSLGVHQPLFAPHWSGRWPRQITVPLLCVTLAISAIQLTAMFKVQLPWPGPVSAVYRWLMPFRSLNHYGLFAVMTTTRPEIIVQGSRDGREWLDYEFKYKPGDVGRRPGFVAPHQPRLDWQMWFAALGTFQNNRWFIQFCGRLLQGSPEVLQLLKANPFPDAPPRYIRAMVYEYHFTDWRTRRRTGAWWRRELKGLYLPPISFQDNREKGSDSAP